MATGAKVVVTDVISDGMEPERAVLGGLAEVVALDAYSEQELVGRIEDADAVMLYHHLTITSQTIERLERCRLIVRCGVGVDNVDLQAARARGIPVANVPDYGSEEVADSAIGMLLALARGIVPLNSMLRDDPRAAWQHLPIVPLRRLRGEVLGIVGLGRIGSAAALRGKSLGMDVLFFDPYKPDGYDKALGIRRAERMEEILQESHAISLHCPLTDQTRHLIDAKALASMRGGSYLINTARGAIVDTTAVPAAIASGRLAGAAIDVLPQEPPSADDPLIQAWRDPKHPAHHRLILNPHAAFYCEQGILEMRSKGARACRRAILGETIPNVVN